MLQHQGWTDLHRANLCWASLRWAVAAIVLASAGCQSTGMYAGYSKTVAKQSVRSSEPVSVAQAAPVTPDTLNKPAGEASQVVPAQATLPLQDPIAPEPLADEPIPAEPLAGLANPAAEQVTAPTLIEVVQSVRDYFPVIQEAEASRTIASGEALSAAGAFDRKLDGYSNVQPLDFYENNWHKWGLKRDTMWGGTVGAGYRVGRGSFEPWYKERETNDGGEFSVGFTAPIGRDRVIDANRAELWRARLERGRVEPFIQSQVIGAVQQGARAYWEWVAAAENVRVAESVLQLGLNRVGMLKREIETGNKARIDFDDNQRIIVTRQAKLIDAERKLQQSAVKLSLFYRTNGGQPLVPEAIDGVRFPEAALPNNAMLNGDESFALGRRPELQELDIIRRQVQIECRQAQNEIRPDIDWGMYVAQDVGNPTKDNDKSELEIETTLTVSVPLERRKARGKVRQIRGKLAQLTAKTRFASDKITAEVRVARAALVAAAERVEQTTEGVRLAKIMQDAEGDRYRLGQSNLINLNLREKQAADAATEQVAAKLDYFAALADYAAALGLANGSLDELYEAL